MITDLVTRCSEGLVERRTLVEAILLAAVAGEHVLVIGPPGTAKSEAARRVARALGGRYFEYLLGKFSEPSELFGPIDLRRLKDGVLATSTEGMLPEAEVAFLDEVFAGSTAILNSLLGLLNERTYRRGNTALACPLRVCIGASNALPESESLAAFADRFLVRCFVEPVSDALLEDMLAGGRQSVDVQMGQMATLDQLSLRARSVELEPIRPLLAQALRRLRKEGIGLSDRRSVRAQNVIAAAAAMAGRQSATAADLWPLLLVVPSASEQRLARECLEPLLGDSDSPTLAGLAEEASAAPRVKARLLLEAGQQALAEPLDLLRVEGVLRDIDANFAAEQLSSELAEMRQRLKSTFPCD